MNEDIRHINMVLAGNHKAYAKLVQKYEGYVFTVVNRIVYNREEAEEAAQDVFIKAFKTLKSYRQSAKFSTWLYRIAYNTAIDYTRKKKRNIESIDQDDRFYHLKDNLHQGQFEQLQHQQREQYINELINNLPPNDGLLISLFYLKEQSIEEIAAIMNLSISNIKVKLFRLRKKLKLELEKILEHEAKELL